MPWAHLRLPPFPQIAVRVLKLAGREDLQLHQLCELIAADGAFASEVLIVANSLLYAPRYPATSILQAIAFLGVHALQGMSITVGARAYLGQSMHYPELRGLWRHNLACAIIAQRLASSDVIDKDVAYTSGILHDIGRFAMAVILPKDYAALLQTHCGPPDSILERERALFGWNHCEVGRRLIDEWNLSREFDAVVLDHHTPLRAAEPWGLGALVKVSCRLADAAGFPSFPGCQIMPYTYLLERLPARERNLFYPNVDQLIREVGAGVESVEAM
jgi:HD-like signal output (HDOD) protein